VAGNRTLSVVRRLFNWSVERDIIPARLGNARAPLALILTWAPTSIEPQPEPLGAHLLCGLEHFQLNPDHILRRRSSWRIPAG
jgi:hypothetical protein